MKIIKIEIQETQEFRPYLEMIRKLSRYQLQQCLRGADITDLDKFPPSYKKDLYPLQIFAIDNHFERFYLRDSDKKAFEELTNAFVLRAEIRLLENLEKYGRENPAKLWKYLLETKKIKEAKEYEKLSQPSKGKGE